MANCERTSGGETEMCGCLLDKVEARYPNPNDAMGMTLSEMSGFAEECR